jgi:hypothetical protein
MGEIPNNFMEVFTMKFREIREITEVKDEKTTVNDNWKKIKPKTNIPPKEIDLFWQEEFGIIPKEIGESSD